MLPHIRKRSSNAPVPEEEVCAEVRDEQRTAGSRTKAADEFCSGRGFSLSTLARHLKKAMQNETFCHKSNNLRPSRLTMSLRFKACPTYPQSCSETARRAIGADPPSTRQISAKLCFTLRVGCHMIVKLVASSPAYFPNGNGKVGIMDSDLSHLQPDLKHNWVGYAVGVAAVVAILPKQQAAAC